MPRSAARLTGVCPNKLGETACFRQDIRVTATSNPSEIAVQAKSPCRERIDGSNRTAAFC